MDRLKRRTNKELEEVIFSTLDELVPKCGFSNISLLKFVEKAGVDHNVIYRKYGTIENMFGEYIKKYDFWLNDIIDIKGINKVSNRVFLINLLQTFYLEFEKSEIMQKVIIWELENISEVTKRSVNLREAINMTLVAYFESVFKDSKIDISPINAFLVSGVYYMVLHKNISNFCGIDFNTESGEKRAMKAIEFIVNLIFDKLEEEKILYEKIVMMLDDGIEPTKIKKYLDVPLAQIKKIAGNK